MIDTMIDTISKCYTREIENHLVRMKVGFRSHVVTTAIRNYEIIISLDESEETRRECLNLFNFI